MHRLNRKQWLATCLSQLYWAGQVPERGNGHRTRTLSPAFCSATEAFIFCHMRISRHAWELPQLGFRNRFQTIPAWFQEKTYGEKRRNKRLLYLQYFLCPLLLSHHSLEASASFPICPPHTTILEIKKKKKHPQQQKKKHRILRQHLLTFNWLWQPSQVASTSMHFNTAPFTFLHFSHFSNSFEHCGFRLLA